MKHGIERSPARRRRAPALAVAGCILALFTGSSTAHGAQTSAMAATVVERLAADAITEVLALLPSRSGAREDPTIVRIETGLVQGVELEPGLRAYRGIPYAAPPIGALRWRPPQPAASWEGVRAALESGPACPQSPLIAFLSGEPLPATSEDCLHADVLTGASADEKLPVIVWIHGGGFVGGWGYQKVYDGRSLGRRGVVFVSFQYRLGPLGFFAHPELSAEDPAGASGDYGLLDQLALLGWVQRNIAAFGGDPESVTVLGESAGATSVLALCASPLARGLFQRAIVESPWVTHENFAPLDDAERAGRALAATLGAEDLARLRALGADELWQKLGATYQPVVAIDGRVLRDHPLCVFARGESLDVPLIVGTTADEGTVFRDLFPWKTAEELARGFDERYGAAASELRELYPVPLDDQAAVARSIARWITDDWFVRGARTMLDGMTHVPARAWQYEFTRASPSWPALGAHHAVELPFVFGTLASPTSADRVLADAIQDAWVRFATTGDPNGAGLPEWPSYEAGEERYLELGATIAVRSALRREACRTLDRLDPIVEIDR